MARPIENHRDQGSLFMVAEGTGDIVLHTEVAEPIAFPDSEQVFDPIHLRVRAEHILNVLTAIVGINVRDGYYKHSQTPDGYAEIRSKHGKNTDAVIKQSQKNRLALIETGRDELWQAAGMQALVGAEVIQSSDINHERDVLFAGFWDKYGGAKKSEERIAYEERMRDYLRILNPFINK